MQDQEAETAQVFPTALRDWAGNQSGGVRRLFDDASGRPTGQILKTHLLEGCPIVSDGVAIEKFRLHHIIFQKFPFGKISISQIPQFFG
jgi:hypothetical protein